MPYIRDFNWALLDVDESVNIMVKTLISVLEATTEEAASNEKVDKGVQSENVEKKNAQTTTAKPPTNAQVVQRASPFSVLRKKTNFPAFQPPD